MKNLRFLEQTLAMLLIKLDVLEGVDIEDKKNFQIQVLLIQANNCAFSAKINSKIIQGIDFIIFF